MIPILIYALISGGMGWAIHKKKWGIAAFSIAILVWLLLMQCIIAYTLHPTNF